MPAMVLSKFESEKTFQEILLSRCDDGAKISVALRERDQRDRLKQRNDLEEELQREF